MLRTYTMRRQDSVLWALSVLMALTALVMPLSLSSGIVQAAQIEAREVTISDSGAAATSVENAFSFSLGTAGEVESIEFEYCEEAIPLATCTAPTGLDVSAATYTSQSGWDGATAFAMDLTGANDCIAAANKACVTRTDTTSETADNVAITIDGITNPTASETVFVRIYTYLDGDWDPADLVDAGTVAFATVNQLTLTAKVAETLDFCVGDTDADSANDCTDITGTTVDLGILDTSTVNESSVDGAVGDQNGYVMIRSNASNGVDVDYSGNTLTSGANTIPANGSESALSAGTAGWGMDVTSLDTSNGSTANLTMDGNFDDATNGTVYWGSTGPTVFDDLMDSSTVVDDEMVILDFEATAGIATPTGVYTTTIMFVGTPNY